METRNVIIDGVEYVPKVTPEVAPEVTPEVPDYPLPLQEGDVWEADGGIVHHVTAIVKDKAIGWYMSCVGSEMCSFCDTATKPRRFARIISRKPLHERVRLGDRVRIHGDEYKVASIYGASEKVVLGSEARQFNFADFDANAELLPREECNAD